MGLAARGLLHNPKFPTYPYAPVFFSHPMLSNNHSQLHPLKVTPFRLPNRVLDSLLLPRPLSSLEKVARRLSFSSLCIIILLECGLKLT